MQKHYPYRNETLTFIAHNTDTPIHRHTHTLYNDYDILLGHQSKYKKSINMKDILKDKDINIKSCSFLFCLCGCSNIAQSGTIWKSMRISMAWKMDNKTNYYYDEKQSTPWIVCEHLNGSLCRGTWCCCCRHRALLPHSIPKVPFHCVNVIQKIRIMK